jgi:hypothetical protein
MSERGARIIAAAIMQAAGYGPDTVGVAELDKLIAAILAEPVTDPRREGWFDVAEFLDLRHHDTHLADAVRDEADRRYPEAK